VADQSKFPETPEARRVDPVAGNLQSLDRAIALMRAAAHSESGLRLMELAGATGLSKSTTHRILSALVEHRLLRLSKDTRQYSPGSEFYRLSVAALRHFSLVDLVRPSLNHLAEATGDTVLLSIVDGREALCLERVTGAFPIKTLTLAAGDRRPLGVGGGSLALLSALPDEERASIVADESARLQRYPAYTAAALERWVRAARRLGHAYNRERVVTGLSAMGVAIPGPDGRPLGAISVAAITTRLEGERLARVIGLVHQECVRIAAEAAER